MKAVVIGAGGHVGLPLSYVMSTKQSKIESVYGIELKQELCDRLNKGAIPFQEDMHGLKITDKLKFGLWDDQKIQEANVIVIIIGTPVDEENNPRLEPLFAIADKLSKFDLTYKTIILRSTVSPGTTEIFTSRLGVQHFNVASCPERVQQGKSVEEIVSLPQIIGMQAGSAGAVAEFFEAFINVKHFYCTAKEAEIGKLFTNMARYVEFAVANEFQMIAESFGVNGAKVLDIFKEDYPRLNIARPGPNVGGPCLFKDGRFLLKNTQGGTIIEEAFRVNEGMPAFIIKLMNEYLHLNHSRVLILGAAFKSESDDIRNSLSFKLKKLLVNEGTKVDIYDPFIAGHDFTFDHEKYNAFVVMTPHECFKDLLEKIANETTRTYSICVDLWQLHNKNSIIESIKK